MNSRNSKSKESQGKPKFDASPYVRPGLTSEEITSIKQSFDMFDIQRTGSIPAKDLKNSLSSIGSSAKNQSLYQLILDYDAQGNGNITFEQFIHLMTPKLLVNDTPQNINSIFALFDTQKTGYISIKQLRQAIKDVGLQVTQKQIQLMLQRADEDKDGRVSKQQFFQLLSQYGK